MREVHYNVNAESRDGERYTWDGTDYPTFEAAENAWTLDAMQDKDPNIAKLIVVEVVRRDVFVRQQIEGGAA